ncbi:MAG: sugar ABC transporter substrate-binding protein [Caldilineaceae bacterium]
MKESKAGKLSRRDFLRVAGLGSATLIAVACAAPGGVPAGGGGSQPASGKITLKVQANPKEEKPVLDAFKSKHPDVDVEYLSITGIDHEEVASKILSMVAAGNIIDLGYAATEATQLYAGQNLAQALDDFVQRDVKAMQDYFSEVHPSLIEAMMYEGSLYELPHDFNAANMYYNTKLFQDAGIDAPKPDWSHDDFLEIAKKITKKGADGKTEVFGYGWTNRLWGSWMPWIFVNGGNLFTEDKAPGGDWLWNQFYKDDPAAKGRSGGWRWMTPKANDPANVEALEFVVMMTKEGIAPAAELGGGQSLQGFFADNKLGMTPAGGFWAGGLHNAGFKKGSFDVQLFPKWKNQRHQFGTGGHFMFSQSKNKDMAWEYVKFRESKEGMTLWYANSGIVTTPSRRSLLNEKAFAESGPEHWSVFYDTLDKHPDTGPIPAPPVSNPMTTLFTNYTGKAMNGELPAADALDQLQKELEALVARSTKIQYPNAKK